MFFFVFGFFKKLFPFKRVKTLCLNNVHLLSSSSQFGFMKKWIIHVDKEDEVDSPYQMQVWLWLTRPMQNKQAWPQQWPAVEGLDRVWWYSVVVLSPVPFILKSGPTGIFKGKENMTYGEMPAIIILSKAGQMFCYRTHWIDSQSK